MRWPQHKEYAEKMRRDLPQTTEVIQKSAVGGTIQRMKSGLQDQLDKSEGFQNFKRRNVARPPTQQLLPLCRTTPVLVDKTLQGALTKPVYATDL